MNRTVFLAIGRGKEIFQEAMGATVLEREFGTSTPASRVKRITKQYVDVLEPRSKLKSLMRKEVQAGLDLATRNQYAAYLTLGPEAFKAIYKAVQGQDLELEDVIAILDGFDNRLNIVRWGNTPSIMTLHESAYFLPVFETIEQFIATRKGVLPTKNTNESIKLNEELEWIKTELEYLRGIMKAQEMEPEEHLLHRIT